MPVRLRRIRTEIEGLERKWRSTRLSWWTSMGTDFLDLLAAGHEYDPACGIICKPKSCGVTVPGSTVQHRQSDNSCRLSIGHGIVVDIDASDTDGDGDKDLSSSTGPATNRTSDYTWGYYVQLVEQVGPRRFVDRNREVASSECGIDAKPIGSSGSACAIATPMETWISWSTMPQGISSGRTMGTAYVQTGVDGRARTTDAAMRRDGSRGRTGPWSQCQKRRQLTILVPPLPSGDFSEKTRTLTAFRSFVSLNPGADTLPV